MAKEKITDYNRVFGTMIVFSDGTIYRDNFDSVQLGNLLGVWRGSITTFVNNINDIYGHDHSVHTYDVKNNNREKVIIPVKKISYIKYIQNTGCMGSKKDPKIYDWDSEFD